MNCKTKKGIVSLAMVLAIFVMLIPNGLAAVVDSGTCGENLNWVLDSDGTFTVSGNGEMKYLGIPEPWGANYNNLKTVVLNDGVTNIAASAFKSYPITSVSLPNTITDIGEAAFWYCENLTSIVIPDSVTNITCFAFAECSKLVSARLPSNIKTMEPSIFRNCKSLVSANIPDGVVKICSYVFDGCTSLPSITIPISVQNIDDSAFAQCNSLTDVYYEGTKTQWKQISIGEYNECLTNATLHFLGSTSTPTTVSFNASALPQAEYGTGYNIKFQMQDGTAPEKVEFTSITPAGLTVNADGTITGTPKVVGNYPSLPVKCTDSSGNTVIKEFDLQVMPQEVHVEIDGDAAIGYDGETHTLPLKCVEVPDLELSALYGVGKTAAPSEAGSYYAQVVSNNPLYRIARDKDYYLTIEKKNIEIAHDWYTPQTYKYDGKSHAYEFVAERGYAPIVKYKLYTASDDLNRPSNDSGYTETPPTEKGKYRVWISAADKNHHIYDGPSTVSMSPYVFGVLEITD